MEKKRLSFFERYLTFWVAACMAVGILLSKLLPALTDALRRFEFGSGSQINVPIAVLIWLMITPMMMKVDFTSIRNVRRRPKRRCGVGRSLRTLYFGGRPAGAEDLPDAHKRRGGHESPPASYPRAVSGRIATMSGSSTIKVKRRWNFRTGWTPRLALPQPRVSPSPVR